MPPPTRLISRFGNAAPESNMFEVALGMLDSLDDSTGLICRRTKDKRLFGFLCGQAWGDRPKDGGFHAIECPHLQSESTLIRGNQIKQRTWIGR